jgi:outer membrane receptor for ferrienterochelin and colicins
MKKIAFIVLYLSYIQAFGQTLIIAEKDAPSFSPLEGVVVSTLDGSKAAASNSNGQVDIQLNNGEVFILRLIGYTPDTLTYQGQDTLYLSSNVLLNSVNINEFQQSTMYSVKPIQTEVLNGKELKKAACCNLGESFETNNSVDLKITDVLLGTQELNIVGLSGSYSPVYVESSPFIFGLNQANGLNNIPGTIIHEISITKGNAPVHMGAESTSGLIMVDVLKPELEKGLLLNVYGDAFNRKELNVHAALKPKSNLNGLLIGHVSSTSNQNDRNGDLFKDMPNNQNVLLLNKWNYNFNNWHSQNMILANMQDTKTGQQNALFNQEDASKNIYSQRYAQKSISFIGKTGYVFPTNKYLSIGNMYLIKSQENSGYFGRKSYSGVENRAYYKLLTSYNPAEKLNINGGFNLHYVDYQEQIDTFAQQLNNLQQGIFTEATYRIQTSIEVIAGLRADQIQDNTYLLPRIFTKICLNEFTNFKLGYGQSAKSYFILSENPNLLSSNRKIVIEEQLSPEHAETFRGSFTYDGKLAGKNFTVLLDGALSHFFNKITPDYDKVAFEAHFSNRSNLTYAKAAQVDVSYQVHKNLTLKASHKVQEVYEDRAEGKWNLVYIPRYKSLFESEFYAFKRTLNWVLKAELQGPKRLPELAQASILNAGEHIELNESPTFWRFGSIINYEPNNKLRFYVGSDNILNTMQHVQILGLNNPFSEQFDTGYSWGPSMGRNIYAGITLKINQ